MPNKKTPIIEILDSLNNLLRDGVSPHTISSEVDKIFELVREFKIKIEINSTKSYYLDEELNHIQAKKLAANTSFEEAAHWRQQEKMMLKEKADQPTAILKTELSFFKQHSNFIIGYLNNNKPNEKLLAQFIKDYQASA